MATRRSAGQALASTEGAPCEPLRGYSDMREGAQVVVSDASGTTLALGTLGQGVIDARQGADMHDPIERLSARCVFTFSVPGVPAGRQFYRLNLGHRGAPQYTEQELRSGPSLTPPATTRLLALGRGDQHRVGPDHRDPPTLLTPTPRPPTTGTWRSRQTGRTTTPRPDLPSTTRPQDHLSIDLKINGGSGLSRPPRLWFRSRTYTQGLTGPASVLDLFSRRLLGYAMSASHDAELTAASLGMAAATRGGHVSGVIFHSDRGSEYTGAEYAAACARLGVTQSMGRVACALDNAAAEAVNSILKTEFVYRHTFTTREQARLASAAGSTGSTTPAAGTAGAGVSARLTTNTNTRSEPRPSRPQHDGPVYTLRGD